MIYPDSHSYISWDSIVFDLNAYEILEPNQHNLEAASHWPGHYTVRVTPLESKRWLHEYGFYYCDSLIEPYCTKDKFKGAYHPDVEITNEVLLHPLIEICSNAFSYGRFHRDFNLNIKNAELRYANWLTQLYNKGQVYGLIYRSSLVGFVAVDANKLVLHALAESIRGNGLAKYFWTKVCQKLFDMGHDEIVSSISATNLAVLNLYTSLGFSFRNPIDIYHRLTQ